MPSRSPMAATRCAFHWMEPASNVPSADGCSTSGSTARSSVQRGRSRRRPAPSTRRSRSLFQAAATAGSGLLVELVSKTVNPAFLCGLEITAANPAGVANPTANLDYSTDGGATWINIATNQPMDLLGRGTFNWTVPNTPSTNVLIRVRANDGTQPSDVSDAPFTINSLTHDFYIDPAGDNANSGRSVDVAHGVAGRHPRHVRFWSRRHDPRRRRNLQSDQLDRH